MNPTIAKLRGYGHHNNPMIRAAFIHLTESDWDEMELESELGMLLVRSYQTTLPEHEALVWKHHEHEPKFDGLVGPATEELLELDRCGHRDFEPLMEGEATGSGSWRPGCNPEIYKDHSVKIHYDLSRASAQVKGWWPEIKAMVHKAYAECGMLLIEVERRSDANITVWFEVLGGSIIGLAQLPGSNVPCSRVVWCKLDPGYLPNPNQVAQLLAHEIGHCLNSGHMDDFIMGPTMRIQTWIGSFLGTPFGARLQGFFGKDPVPPKPPDQPPTDQGKIALRGRIRLQNYGNKPVVIQPGGEYEESFILVPE
jgi:hypothetical protein